MKISNPVFASTKTIASTVQLNFSPKTLYRHVRYNYMSSYIDYLTIGDDYGHFWRRYRPVLLKLMIASAEGPQQYKFSTHEVKAANPKDKGRFTFDMTLHKSKAVNDIRSSVIGKGLLRVLQQSGKASELSGSSSYEFKLDKHFVLHVTKVDLREELPESSQSIVSEPIEG
jgi:hypothetical protein